MTILPTCLRIRLLIVSLIFIKRPLTNEDALCDGNVKVNVRGYI